MFRSPLIFRALWIAGGLAVLLAVGRDAVLREKLLAKSDGAHDAPWCTGDFRADGVWSGTKRGARPEHVAIVGSWIGGDEWQGRAETAWFAARDGVVRVCVAGYPRHRGCQLAVEFRHADGAVTRAGFDRADPHEQWTAWDFRPPPGAVALRLVAEDRVSDTFGWFAFSRPFTPWPGLVAAYTLAQALAILALAATFVAGVGLFRVNPPGFATFAVIAGAIACLVQSGPVATGLLALLWAAFGARAWRSGWKWESREARIGAVEKFWARAHAFATHPPLWLSLLACAAILAARRPDAFRTPQFWSEDGIFYEQACTLGACALAIPYAGYLHTVPRLVSAFAAMWDPARAPAIFVGWAALFTLYVAARTQSARCLLPRHAGFAFAVVLVPDALEVLANVVNLQWILAGGLLLLLLSADPLRWWQWLHDIIVAIAVGLTGPFSVLFAPLFAWRAWQRRTQGSLLLAALVVAAGAVQAWTLWPPPPVPEHHLDGGTLLAVPGLRVGGSLLLGKFVRADFSSPANLALGLLTLAGVAALAWHRGAARRERIVLAVAFALLLASSLYRCRADLPSLFHEHYWSRYFYPLQLVVIWLVLATASAARSWIAWSAILVVLWMLAVNLPRLREPSLPDNHWELYAPKIRAGEEVIVPINPGWTIPFPARQSRGH